MAFLEEKCLLSSVSNQRLIVANIAGLLKEISSYSPDHIILTLLRYIRERDQKDPEISFIVPYTRQQIADMTGLRVETVIRTIKRLQKEGKLEIREHKIILQ